MGAERLRRGRGLARPHGGDRRRPARSERSERIGGGTAVRDAAGADGVRPREPRARGRGDGHAGRRGRERRRPRHAAGRRGGRPRRGLGERRPGRARGDTGRARRGGRHAGGGDRAAHRRVADDRRGARQRHPDDRRDHAARPGARRRLPRREHLRGAARGQLVMSTSDWSLIALEGLVVIGFIALGVRSGGIGLGLWGGVGTLVLVFGFGLAPGEPPVSAMLIIIAVISASAAMQAAGGIDYMVLIAGKALRARPRMLNFAAPYVSWLLTILTGTGNTFFSLIPVINELAYANKIRPERALAGSAVASTFGITASPVAAAMATMLPLVEVYGYDIVDVMLITIPASIVGIFVMALVMNTHGKDLDDDVEFQRRLASGEIKPPAPAGQIELLPYAKRSVAIFLTAVAAICVFGVFEGLRPTIPAEGGGVEPLSVTPIIQMFMLTAAALILILAHVQTSDVASAPIFKSGMIAMIALFGIAWMADTFIANNEDAIVAALGGLAENWPFTIALAVFLVAALTTSQSAATRTMIPLGLALGIGAGYMIAFWTAVAGVLFFPANGTQIAADEADETGSTTLGKRVLDHSFQLPLQIAWVVTALVGCLIVYLFFGDHTPAPPAPTTTTA